MAQSEKQRFEMHDDRIRAFYGHSITLKMQHELAIPPALLYHGTTPQAAKIIRVEGLKPMKRQYVHLSADEETARQVALRRTQRPVILHIDALAASQQGITFYLGNDKVWLADHIPPAFISF
jgi:putative RNA 2'-phosphotransferase